MQEVVLFSERQEVLAVLMEDKIRIQSKATEKYYETYFEELRELEEKKSKEALVLVQKTHVDGEDRERQDEGLMLKTPSLLSHARPLLVIWKK